MHSNVTIKNVSWPHFSWATLYSLHSTYATDEVRFASILSRSRRLCGCMSTSDHVEPVCSLRQHFVALVDLYNARSLVRLLQSHYIVTAIQYKSTQHRIWFLHSDTRNKGTVKTAIVVLTHALCSLNAKRQLVCTPCPVKKRPVAFLL